MANAADLVIRVTADTSRARSELDQTAGTAGKFSSTMGKMAAPAAAALLAVGAAAKVAVDSASRTQQAYGALDAVFGDNASTVKGWAADSAKSVGLASSEYAELASTIGAQLKNMGLPMDDVTKKTKGLVSTGADLAATFGGSTAEAVEALSSALRGETDPIEKYGVAIKEADIKARMAADGTDKLTGSAAKQARTAALLAMITEQTADAHGQFARESDSAAGSAQIAAAQMENMKSSMGQVLLPVVSMLAGALGGLAEVVGENTKAAQIIIGVLAGVAAAVLAINAALKVYKAGLIVVAAVQKATFLTNPIFLVIAAVVLLTAGIVLLWRKSETFRTVVLAVWNAIRTGAVAVANVLRTVFMAAWNFIEGQARGFRETVAQVFGAIRNAASVVGAALRAVFSGVWGALREGAAGMREAVSGAFRAVRETVGVIAGAIREVWSGVMSAIRGSVGGLGAILAGPFNAMKGAIDAVVGAVQNLIHWLGSIKVPKINLPNIPGLNSVMAPPPAQALTAASRAPGVPGGPAARALVPGGSTGPTFVINGAIDPEATARQIRRILAGHDRRMGLTT